MDDALLKKELTGKKLFQFSFKYKNNVKLHFNGDFYNFFFLNKFRVQYINL